MYFTFWICSMPYLLLLKEKFFSYAACLFTSAKLLRCPLFTVSQIVPLRRHHITFLSAFQHSWVLFSSIVFIICRKCPTTGERKPYQEIIVFQILPGNDTLKNTTPRVTWALRQYAKNKTHSAKRKYRGVMVESRMAISGSSFRTPWRVMISAASCAVATSSSSGASAAHLRVRLARCVRKNLSSAAPVSPNVCVRGCMFPAYEE